MKQTIPFAAAFFLGLWTPYSSRCLSGTGGSSWRRKLFLPLLLTMLVAGGCATNRVYKTLYTVGHATDGVVRTYYQMVVAGTVPTNGVPRVSRTYTQFQAAYNAALAIAQFNVQAPAPTNLVGMSELVISTVQEASRK